MFYNEIKMIYLPLKSIIVSTTQLAGTTDRANISRNKASKIKQHFNP